MRLKFIIRIAGLAVAGVAATAFLGLPWAAANSRAVTTFMTAKGLLCGVRYDGDDQAGCLGHGPRGRPGPRGWTGWPGQPGVMGSKGIQGAPGAFVGGGPNAHTLVRVGTPIGPVTITSTAPALGQELGPSVAVCPTTGMDRQAFDGGAIITTVNPKKAGPTGDVVGLESSYPGRYNGTSEVDPITVTRSGTVLPQPANAYSVTAVITQMHSGDNVTVQAYVVCGP